MPINSPNVFSRFPEWVGSLLATASGSRIGKHEEALIEAVVVAAVENDDETPLEIESNQEVQNVVDEMLSQSRYALLLRPQLIGNLSREQLARTRAALSDGMCLVPEGPVMLRRTYTEEAAVGEPAEGPILQLQALYLDRYPVTNGQYHHFVTSGGYEQMSIWDPEIWPALLDFVDSSGQPGPRFWRHGRYPRGEEQHPVVGVSWYEAVAYSRWVGKRLPSDAEWVKAGSWPVQIPGHPLMQRRYPWGEAMDRARANLWGSGPGRTVSVYEFPSGVSVGGVQQLIGNVWEWTFDAFTFPGNEAGQNVQTKMKSLRGGAFDTYLDCQTTCHFQSADVALARKHNVGFRCAINVSDLASHREPADVQADETDPSIAENSP